MNEGFLMDFLLDSNLSLQSKAIYMYLLQLSNGDKEFQMKPQYEIRKELGIGDYQYHSHLKKLVENGYLQLEMTRDEKKRYNGYKCTILGGKN